MKRALIIGDSGAIGGAVAARLRADGVEVVGLSRSRDGLDVTDGASVARVLGALEGPFDFLLVATGALEIGGAGPEKALRDIEAEAMAAQFALNAIGPALVLREAGRLMPRDGRSVCAVLTARVGSIGDNRLGGWHSYRAAKAAANQIVRGASIELGRTHKEAVVVALHPGTVQSDLTKKYLGRHPAVTPEAAAEHLLSVVGGLTAEDIGGFFDWKGERVEW
ncbi:SDR family oxidoreductase [Pseudooceanicola onchidii]|uniref:SDR family oxidoreductase n=1 Tax=Pseudooceanicola onchidii TaxID=2562279 RepID=UPI0010AAE099|nr:SDR family oxidoreductase [Pseudooceanicola onchidii]